MNCTWAADAASLNLSGRPGSTLERPPFLSEPVLPPAPVPLTIADPRRRSVWFPAVKERHPGPAHPALIVADAGRLSVATLPLLGAA